MANGMLIDLGNLAISEVDIQNKRFRLLKYSHVMHIVSR